MKKLSFPVQNSSKRIALSYSRVCQDIKGLGNALDDNIAAILLFGSYARDEQTPLSDIDLAYLLGDGLLLDREEEIDRELYLRLSHIFNTDDITVINLRKISPCISFQVLREGKIISCHKPEILYSFKERLLSIYAEIKAFRHKNLAEFELSLKGVSMDIDKERILFYLRSIKEEIAHLQEIPPIKKEEYLADSNLQIVVERRFQRAIESCLNIGNHFISRLGLKLAEDYASVFKSLSEGQVISYRLAEKMTDMARFRNLLVHLYWEIEHERIYEQRNDRLSTLEEFIKEIHQFINKKRD